MPDQTSFLLAFLELVSGLFVLLVALLVLGLAVLYAIDVTQTAHAMRRYYPLVGFRHLLEHLGGFFRKYFFALDREEMPFNRAQRSWVYRAAKNLDNTVAFGSARDLRPAGTILFVNCPFPSLGEDAAPAEAVTIGPHSAQPYTTSKIVHIAGMSYGAISRAAVLALSSGARLAGCWLNSGEGGLSSYHLEGGADIVFQIGTAKNGVRDLDGSLSEDKLRAIAAHENVRMFELKLSQGSQPGGGGILPAVKVSEEVARIRGIPAGRDAVSPNRHPEIDSTGELLDLLQRIREVSGKPVGFKTVIGACDWLEALCAEVRRRGVECAPDFVAVDGAEGGSAAAPMSLSDDLGLPLRESLPMLVDTLDRHALRGRIRVVASGKLITPADVAWALCAGADFIAIARGFMFALGCMQALQCNNNTCPTGITTHDPRLQRGLDAGKKAVRVYHYQKNIEHEVGTIAHACGVRSPRRLRRMHARVVTHSGRSIPLDELYPEVTPAAC